jgi:hypothetical protein
VTNGVHPSTNHGHLTATPKAQRKGQEEGPEKVTRGG